MKRKPTSVEVVALKTRTASLSASEAPLSAVPANPDSAAAQVTMIHSFVGKKGKRRMPPSDFWR